MRRKQGRWLRISWIKRMSATVRTLYTSFLQGTHTVTGEKVLHKIRHWLTPPDPSTNYNNGLRNLHWESATWLLDGRVFQDWHSTDSLLWIHGKRMLWELGPYLFLMLPTFDSRFGEEHPLVRHFYTNLTLHSLSS